MKHIKRYGLLFLMITWAQLSFAQSFMVGAGSRNINPDNDSLYMAGGDPNRPFIDVHDSLYAKAVFIGNQEQHIVLLTFDCIGLMYPALLEIREKVKHDLPSVDPSRIVMSSTHTHAGPDVVGIWGKNFSQSGVNQHHMQKIISSAVAAIKEAFDKRTNCTMQYAEGKFGEDWVKNISEPNEIDRTISVVRFINQEKRSIATLTNFACHPTIMDDATRAASSDYVWGYYHYLDSIQGGINMFLQGAIGGWIQPEDVPSSFDNALHYGRSMGSYVYSMLSTARKNKSNQIVFKSKSVTFPMKNQGFSVLSKAGVIKRVFGETVASEIASFSIGDAQFATHPGETVPAMGLQTRSLMKGDGPKFVMGLSQDALGYILKPSFFTKGNKIPHSEYLTGMSIGPDTMKIIMDTLQMLLSNQ
jgi:hypothetical protein